MEINDYFIVHYPCYKSEYTSIKELRYIDKLKESTCTKIIHGHVHDRDPKDWVPDEYDRINVCVDFKENNYYPRDVSFPEIVEFFSSNV